MFYQRASFLRKSHRSRKRQLLKELRSYIGKHYKSPLDPIPARERKKPTYMELLEYWDVAQ
jgi:hypothetical protein